MNDYCPIKFRIWDKQLNKWGSVAAILFQLNNNSYSVSQETIERFEFQQFTGFLDKNNKEIYDGDRVKLLDDRLQTINWSNGGWHVGFPHRYSELARCPRENIEIINNIYET